MTSPGPVLTATGLSKSYAGPVLSAVDLELRGGEVLALTGENGAGKSTLARILAGLVRPDAGAMRLAGEDYRPSGRAGAERRGVRMVLQELNVVPTLSVAENIFLHRLPHRLGWIDRPRLRAQAREALARVGLGDLAPDTPLGALGLGHRQMVEIARSLADSCRVLILDEPTAMLTAREVEQLFDRVRQLRAEGVATVFVSHRLEELPQIADRVAVLRDGRLVAAGPMAGYPPAELVRLMAGRETAAAAGSDSRPASGPVVLRVAGLGRAPAVRDISLEVRRGEVLGLAGLVGSGRTELLRLIFGADRATAGEIWLGHPLRRVALRSPRDAVRAGVALVTEDRKGEGLLLPESVRANIALGNLEKLARRGPLGRWLGRGRDAALARRQVTTLGIRCAGTEQAARELSGGNQQKVVLARWLERDGSVILLDEPTRGIDVGARFEIHRVIDRLARRGKALVVVSSDLPELMALADRIIVLRAGRMAGEFARGAWSRDAILAAAFSGVTEGAA